MMNFIFVSALFIVGLLLLSVIIETRMAKKVGVITGNTLAPLYRWRSNLSDGARSFVDVTLLCVYCFAVILFIFVE